jgi:uncharacterized membrane protein YkvA (DUF1232 family)
MSNKLDLNEISNSVDDVQKQTGLTRSLWQHTRLVWRMFRSKDVPLVLKMLPIAAVAYVLSPLDFVPDTIPALGQLDDIGILLLGMKLFIDMAPQHVVDSIMNGIRLDDGDMVLTEKEPDQVIIIDQL